VKKDAIDGYLLCIREAENCVHSNLNSACTEEATTETCSIRVIEISPKESECEGVNYMHLPWERSSCPDFCEHYNES
jgi:hypothetical protein